LEGLALSLPGSGPPYDMPFWISSNDFAKGGSIFPSA